MRQLHLSGQWGIIGLLGMIAASLGYQYRYIQHHPQAVRKVSVHIQAPVPNENYQIVAQVKEPLPAIKQMPAAVQPRLVRPQLRPAAPIVVKTNPETVQGAKQKPQDITLHTTGRVKSEGVAAGKVIASRPGILHTLYVSEGAKVVKGQPIVQIFSPELDVLQKSFRKPEKVKLPEDELIAPGRSARVVKDAAQERSNRESADNWRKQLRQLHVSELQIREFERTGQINPYITLCSPVSGHVTGLKPRNQHLTYGGLVCTVQTSGKRWLETAISQRDGQLIKPGQTLYVISPRFPTYRLAIQVERVLPGAHTTRLWLTLPDSVSVREGEFPVSIQVRLPATASDNPEVDRQSGQIQSRTACEKPKLDLKNRT